MSDTLFDQYPHLQFKRNWKLSEKSLLLLGQCEAYVDVINQLPVMPKLYRELMQLSLLKGAQSTTAIEGNTLNDEEIRQIMDHRKLPPSKEYQETEVKNILDAFNELHLEVIEGNAVDFISVPMLKRFHKMVGRNLGDYFQAIPGQLRAAPAVVGNYRCPDHHDVPVLLEKLCKWLKQEFKYGLTEQPFHEMIVQAVVTHLLIEWIHPFGDGNGRTGRLIEYYILLRGGNPDITSHILSNYYNLTRPAYYHHIQKAYEDNDLSGFIEYALLGFRDGLAQTFNLIRDSHFQELWKKLIYDRFNEVREGMRSDMLKRLRTLMLEIPLHENVSPDKVDSLSIPIAKIYSGISSKTIQRDLEKLCEMELLIKSADGYKANAAILNQMLVKRKTNG